MITVSMSAIPIHFGLLKFALPEEFVLTLKQGIIIVIPTLAFLIAAIIFTFGYYPKIGNFSLDMIDEIENQRTQTIQRRKKITIWGSGFFIFGAILMILSLTFILTYFNKLAS